jgi:hypothetical protein
MGEDTMKRFEYAIKAIEHEKLRVIGKYVDESVKNNHDPLMALERSKVKHLNEAIEILTEHHRNNHV